MPFTLPKSSIDWERTLCRYFLSVRDGDATPIRSLEVTKSTLAESCDGDPVEDAEAAFEAFCDTFNTKATISALEKGAYRPLTTEGLPGCFCYLAFTLLVDALLDEEIQDLGAFRAKLASLLDTDRKFSDLSGVARMWRDLKHWLDTGSRDEYRQLELPPIPESWTHIGYTLRLSFPSRRDRRVMKAFLDAHPSLLKEPQKFLVAFRRVADRDDASWGMRQAFEEFRHDFLAGHRALSAHRFWALVQGLAAGKETSLTAKEISIELVRDQDDDWVFVLEDLSDASTERSHLRSLGEAVKNACRLEPNQLATAISKGCLVFRQVGHGKWSAATDLSECVGQVFVGFSGEVANKVGTRLGALSPSGDWMLTQGPVAVGVVESVLTRAIGRLEAPAQVVGVSVFDGIKSGSAWLGRLRFLPIISADGFQLEIFPEKDSKGTATCVEDERARGIYHLEAQGPLDGRFVLSPSTGSGERRRWSKNLLFVANAYVHENQKYPRSPNLVEWDGVKVSDEPEPSFSPAWDEVSREASDLAEAVYAGGRSGWDEADIISLIRRWSFGTNPWDVLRLLQESKILSPALRPLWKGRVWYLEAPTLVAWQSNPEETLVVLDGCISARLLEDFLRAVEGLRGIPFRRCATSNAMPIVGCIGVKVDRLQSKLGWAVSSPTTVTNRQLAFHLTTRQPEGYLLAAKWSWDQGRFSFANESTDTPVTLARWKHPAGRDHDLYVITQFEGSRCFLSRNAAIAAAHSLSGSPLFTVRNDRLERIRNEGALPDGVAAALRYRTLSNPELSVEGGRYAYRTDLALAHSVAGILPNLVTNLADSSGTSALDAVSLAVHSGGRIRVAWKSGRLSTTHSS